MSSNARPVIVRCSRCDYRFEDWWRPPVDLTRDHLDADYLDQATDTRCPRCGAELRFDALVAEGGALMEPGDGRAPSDEPTM